MAQPLSESGSASTLAWAGFYCFLIHTSKKVFIHYAQPCFRWLLFTDNKGKDVTDYFLQINKEKMLQMQGKMRVIGLVTLPSLGELAQTSGSYFKDMHAVSICCFNSEWGSFSKSKPQSNLGIMQAWFPTGKLIHGFGFLCADSCLSVFW